jgi:hypothetical protein
MMRKKLEVIYMPKYLKGKVTVTTLETFANTGEEADKIFKTYLESETEDLESGVKARQYKLQWEENPDVSILVARNEVLSKFLDLIQRHVGGGLPEKEISRILLPFAEAGIGQSTVEHESTPTGKVLDGPMKT